MLKKNKVMEKIKRHCQDAEIKQLEVFSIDGKIVVTEKFLSLFYGVTTRAVRMWREKGLQVDEISTDRFVMYNFAETVQWHSENIKSKFSQTKPKYDFSNTPLEDVDKEEADRLLTIEKVKIERTKHLELTKKLIPAEDTDKAMAELGALHLAQYKSDLKLLPILLENKSKQEITPLLDDHYAARIEDMHTIVNRPKAINGKTFFNAIMNMFGSADK